MPSVTTSRRVSLANCRSKRMCQPISEPTVQPRSSAIRFAIARAATRRGCSSSTRPRSISDGGTRVVLPAPGAAVSTAARWRSSAARMESRAESTGRAGSTGYHQSLLVPRSLRRRGIRQGYSSIHDELRNTLEPDPVQTGGGRAEDVEVHASADGEHVCRGVSKFNQGVRRNIRRDAKRPRRLAGAGSRSRTERRRTVGSSVRHQRSARPRSAAGPAETA